MIASSAMRALLVCALLLTASFVVSGGDLKVYFVDVEGGQATLVVSPSGESLLIDAGYAGFATATPIGSPRSPETPA